MSAIVWTATNDRPRPAHGLAIIRPRDRVEIDRGTEPIMSDAEPAGRAQVLRTIDLHPAMRKFVAVADARDDAERAREQGGLQTFMTTARRNAATPPG